MKNLRSKLFIFILVGLFMISFASAITRDNLISYHSFDQSSGSTVDNNMTSTGTDLTIVNTDFSWISGKIGNAGRIDGVTGGVVSFNFTDLTDYQIGSDNFSMNFWFLADATSAPNKNVRLFSVAGVSLVPLPLGSSGLYVQSIGTTNNFRWGTTFNSGNYEDNQGWQMATTVKNGTSCSLYLNRSLTHVNDCSATNWNTISQILFGNFNGVADDNGAKSYDEAGFWMRALDQSDINDLYNSGSGIGFSGILDTGSMNLLSPGNATNISDIGADFIINGTVPLAYNVTNMTYFVWDGSGIFNQTTVTNASAIKNFSETLFIDSFINDVYFWNAEVCYANATFSNCLMANNNNTLFVQNYSIISQIYTNPTNEGDSVDFSALISVLDPALLITGINFYYNNTIYSGSSQAIGDDFNLSITGINVPLVSADLNISFKWGIELSDGSSHNFSEFNQTVSNLLFSICGGASSDVLANFSLVDELTKGNLSGDIQINADIISKSSGEIVASTNGTGEDVFSYSICFTPVSSYPDYYLDAEIRYSSDGFASEFFFIQKADLSDYPVNITLYDLNLNSSTEFLVKYQDSNLVTVAGAVIQLLRKNIGEDVYSLVEAPLTSNLGTAVVHIDLNTNLYRAIVVKDGVILDTFDNIVFHCENELSGQCNQNLFGVIDPQNSVTVDTINDFSYTITQVNETLTVTFSVPSGTPSTINLNLRQEDTFGNSSMCNQTIVSSGGSIDCSYNATIGDSIVYIQIRKNGVLLGDLSLFVPEGGGPDFGGVNFFIVLIILLTLVGMAYTSPEYVVIVGIVSFVLAGGLWLLNGVNLVVGLGLIAWVIIAGVIIIMKLAEQEDR